ncbi:peptidylprolyl isomerase [Azospira sp. I13]|uniref:peptidylprolyl isomerase n=1 Tax=Azospira sp. I13 TaxID=1765050 RepID=UPI000D452EED|nr:peptidylprolyl isomerase [Azospira sp. I13]GBG01302.1 peptidylprolyl isomerase [Azospira sp. I13]
MQTVSKLAAALVCGALLSANAMAQKAAPAVIVNGTAVPQTLADAFIAEQKAQGAQEGPELRAAVREELVRREILTQEAKKKGLDKKPEIASQMGLASQAVLIRAFIQDYIKNHPVSEAQLKKDYEQIKSQLGGKEYKARHILVETEAEAKVLLDKLKKGEKFEDLAKQSKDPGSKDNGGDLGWSNPSNYVKPFAEALIKLEKGKLTEAPVKSDFGWHIIQLDDTRPLTPPAFEQVKPQLQQRAQQQVVEGLLKDLRAKAKVE